MGGDPGVESRSTSVGVGPSTVVEALFWWLFFWLVSDLRCVIASDRPPRHGGRPMSAFLPPIPAWSSCSAVACGPAVAWRTGNGAPGTLSAQPAELIGRIRPPPNVVSLSVVRQRMDSSLCSTFVSDSSFILQLTNKNFAIKKKATTFSPILWHPSK